MDIKSILVVLLKSVSLFLFLSVPAALCFDESVAFYCPFRVPLKQSCPSHMHDYGMAKMLAVIFRSHVFKSSEPVAA